MSSKSDNVEVLIPIWVLKAKVEQDWKEYKDLHSTPVMDTSLLEIDLDDEADTEFPVVGFPELDSTTKCLEILEKYGIYFNTEIGDWN